MVKSGQFQSRSPAFRWDLEILACDWLKQCEVPSQIWTPFWHPLVQISPIVPQTLIQIKKQGRVPDYKAQFKLKYSIWGKTEIAICGLLSEINQNNYWFIY